MRAKHIIGDFEGFYEGAKPRLQIKPSGPHIVAIADFRRTFHHDGYISLELELEVAPAPLGPVEGHNRFSDFLTNESLRRTSLQCLFLVNSGLNPVHLRTADQDSRLRAHSQR
jgi:hypothetical protein